MYLFGGTVERRQPDLYGYPIIVITVIEFHDRYTRI